MDRPRSLLARSVLPLALASAVAAPRPAAAQSVSDQTRQRALAMLEQVRKDLLKYYFDSTFGGLDLEARFRHADSAVRAAPDNNRLMGAIAQFVSELNDSHTRFFPPSRVAKVDYGYGVSFFGDSCFVTSVKPGSDAEAKGLKVGDAVLAVDAFRPERKTYLTLEYIYNSLNPRPGKRLVVRSPSGERRTLEVMAKVTEGERIIDLTEPEHGSAAARRLRGGGARHQPPLPVPRRLGAHLADAELRARERGTDRRDAGSREEASRTDSRPARQLRR